MGKRKKVDLESNEATHGFDLDTPIKNPKGYALTKSESLKLYKAEKIKKEAVLTLRINKQDLSEFKQIANKKGVGYQTLLGQIIHLYINNILIDIDEIKKIFLKEPKKVSKSETKKAHTVFDKKAS